VKQVLLILFHSRQLAFISGLASVTRSALQDHWNSQRCLGSSRTGEFADHDKKLSAAVNGSGYNVAG